MLRCTQASGTGTLTLARNDPSYLGNVYVNGGTVVLDGSIGGTVTPRANTTFAGHGSAGGLVDINSTFYRQFRRCGYLHGSGRPHIGRRCCWAMDLSSSIASGNGSAVQVNGDATMNGNNVTINPISGTLANGAYPLISYTGNFNGTIGAATTI